MDESRAVAMMRWVGLLAMRVAIARPMPEEQPVTADVSEERCWVPTSCGGRTQPGSIWRQGVGFGVDWIHGCGLRSWMLELDEKMFEQV